jgi:1-deoxy-D-xylulose-5-phosphate reductoisomerase
VAAFLDGRLRWPAIAEVVDESLQAHEPTDLDDVQDVLDADALARVRAASAVERRQSAA